MQTSEVRSRGPMAEALSYGLFRRIWVASLFSNFGLLVQSVGAAWAMTELTAKADMVALVQTASFLPMMLFALSAGAIADTYDRRKVAIISLCLSLVGALLMTATAWYDMLTAPLILFFTFMIGIGVALFGPSWQASVSEQVPAHSVPAAISLNSISYNIARSFGPAIGGIIVAMAGPSAAFLVNALFFLPMLMVLFLWQRKEEPARLPPERLNRAVISGVRYVIHSPNIRIIILRTILTATTGCAFQALLPLVARDLLQGDARTYGVMLGAFGVGAVIGALSVNSLRSRLSAERIVQLSSVMLGLAMIAVAFSRTSLITIPALLFGGWSWLVAVTIYNIGIQTVLPRWVSGRALASFQTAIAGGIAIGAWMWGQVAEEFGTAEALTVSGIACLLSVGAVIWLRMPEGTNAAEEASLLSEPEVELELTSRSGPIIVEILYKVPRYRARAFYRAMQEVQRIRQRNGGYDWSIARDIGCPEVWKERFHCPTWLDYLRQRSRVTQAEREVLERANSFHEGEGLPPVRRLLERPFGSVRWREDVRDLPNVAAPPGPATP